MPIDKGNMLVVILKTSKIYNSLEIPYNYIWFMPRQVILNEIRSSIKSKKYKLDFHSPNKKTKKEEIYPMHNFEKGF